MASKRIVFIVNPHAGNGSTGRRWPRIQAMARDRLGYFTSHLTARAGDAAIIARTELIEGAELIVCVGGDGTLNEVVNGFMDESVPIRNDTLLGFVPNGTGCDIIKTVPIPEEIEQSLDTIKEGYIKVIDVGRLQHRDNHGLPVTRYFHNIVSFGLGGEVDERINKSSKAFGPFISFIWATLVSIFLYGKKNIRIEIDNSYSTNVIAWNIAIANGQYHGGGMLVAPDAVIDDGLFHITVIGNLTLAEVFRHLPKLYNGRIKDIKDVTILTGKTISASSPERVLVDCDGEQPCSLPIVADIVPAALRLITRKL
ncbi:MAG: diacylglycerol/lipid kinase family protein [Syntrophales bacterium]